MNILIGEIPEEWEKKQKDSKLLKVLEPLNVGVGEDTKPFLGFFNVVIFYDNHGFKSEELCRTYCKMFDDKHDTFYKLDNKFYQYISSKVYWSEGWYVKHLLVERDLKSQIE